MNPIPLPTESITRSRTVEQLVTGQATSDGAGVKLTRVLTPSLQRRLDPFLMLDAFGSDQPDDYIAGFPDHPHRGFETITYLIAGRMRHRDNAGHEGILESGGVQWMTAGRGVIHSEIPQQEDGVMEGFQLWLNLPARDKMTAPWVSRFCRRRPARVRHRGGGRGHGDRGSKPRGDRRRHPGSYRAVVSGPASTRGRSLHPVAAGGTPRFRLCVSRRRTHRRSSSTGATPGDPGE